MSRRYDSRTTIFSPEGRLYQVEYAMEAISHAGSVLGITCRDGVIIAAERKVTSKLLDEGLASEKIYPINEKILCGVAGITSDANSLIDYARISAQQYLFTYNSEITGEQLVNQVCNLKQGYTQYGGLRPYGVSFLYACHDNDFGFQLYHSDPSGNYAGWKATCIGANNSAATSMLKTEYKDDGTEITLEDAFKMVMRVMLKTMDGSKLSEEKLEFGALLRGGPGEEDQIQSKIYSSEEVKELISRYAPPPEHKDAPSSSSS